MEGPEPGAELHGDREVVYRLCALAAVQVRDPVVARADRRDRVVVENREPPFERLDRPVEVVDLRGPAAREGEHGHHVVVRDDEVALALGRSPRRHERGLETDAEGPPSAMKRFVNDTQFPRRFAKASAAENVESRWYSKVKARPSRSASLRCASFSSSSPSPPSSRAAAVIAGVTAIGFGTSAGSTPRRATPARHASGLTA